MTLMNIVKKRLIAAEMEQTPAEAQNEKEKMLKIVDDVNQNVDYKGLKDEIPKDIPTRRYLPDESMFKNMNDEEAQAARAMEVAKLVWNNYKYDKRTVPLWSLDATDEQIESAIAFFSERLKEDYHNNYKKLPKLSDEVAERATRELFQL